MTFMARLRQLKDGKGFSEARLATESGLPYATVHNYILGRRLPSYAAVVKLARALGVDCTAFQDCEDIANGEAEAAKPTATSKPKRTRREK